MQYDAKHIHLSETKTYYTCFLFTSKLALHFFYILLLHKEKYVATTLVNHLNQRFHSTFSLAMNIAVKYHGPWAITKHLGK